MQRTGTKHLRGCIVLFAPRRCHDLSSIIEIEIRQQISVLIPAFTGDRRCKSPLKIRELIFTTVKAGFHELPLGQYTQDGISYVPDTSKLKNSSTFTPHIFTVEEIRRLLYAADNLPVRNNAPTRHLVIPAVIRLLYCCGFRIGEVLRLRVKDVDLDTGIITVHNGKGGKDRLVPVHNSVIEYLRSYSAQLPDEREWFFPSACGHYSIKTIYDNFRELLFACNIPHTGNGPRVHDFRHTFAVHTLEKQLSDGYDPMVIVPRLAAYLGHKSYRETCWYIHLTVASFPELSQKLDRAFVGIIPVGGETDEEN